MGFTFTIPDNVLKQLEKAERLILKLKKHNGGWDEMNKIRHIWDTKSEGNLELYHWYFLWKKADGIYELHYSDEWNQWLHHGGGYTSEDTDYGFGYNDFVNNLEEVVWSFDRYTEIYPDRYRDGTIVKIEKTGNTFTQLEVPEEIFFSNEKAMELIEAYAVEFLTLNSMTEGSFSCDEELSYYQVKQIETTDKARQAILDYFKACHLEKK